MGDTQSLSVILTGTTLGSYRLLNELGRGGMGAVYYAEHMVIGRRVAIKVLHADVSKDPVVVSRFLTEARAVNEIRHPNVVEITDIGQQEDLHYIVMTYLDGETLDERLDREQVCDERTAIRIARQVAAALAAAHAHGIIHRDLKPQNIFLAVHPDFPDHVKVLDFGIAKLLGSGGGPEKSIQTAAGMVMGTPMYMAPEQCLGHAVDPRSDVYALGIVLYEMLVGRVPFGGPSLEEVLRGHTREPPVPAIEANPRISVPLNAVVMRALEKQPDQRFATMNEMRAALDATIVTALSATGKRPVATGTRPKGQTRAARLIADELTKIIMDRIAHDRLVLPVMPEVVVRCMELVDDPSQSFQKLAETIARDPLLASQILNLSNSAAFPSIQRATTVEQSLSRLGTSGLKIALVEFSLHQAFVSRNDRIRAAFRGIWQHSVAVALVSKAVATALAGRGPDPNTTYLAGLLHDVGKPAVAALLLEAERQLADTGAMTWVGDTVWKRIVDDSQRRVGVLLATRWRLPEEISGAIERASEYDRGVPTSCSNVVCLANAVVKKHGIYAGEVDAGKLDALIDDGRRLLGLDEAALAAAVSELHRRVATLVDTGSRPNRPRTVRSRLNLAVVRRGDSDKP